MGRIYRRSHVCNFFVTLDSQLWTCVPRHNDHYNLARSAFKNVRSKNLDYPEALWDVWVNFEYVLSSLVSLEDVTAHRACENLGRGTPHESLLWAAKVFIADDGILPGCGLPHQEKLVMPYITIYYHRPLVITISVLCCNKCTNSIIASMAYPPYL